MTDYRDRQRSFMLGFGIGLAVGVNLLGLLISITTPKQEFPKPYFPGKFELYTDAVSRSSVKLESLYETSTLQLHSN